MRVIKEGGSSVPIYPTHLIMEMPKPKALTILVKTLYFQRLVQVSSQGRKKKDARYDSLLSKVNRKDRSEVHWYFTSVRIPRKLEEEHLLSVCCLQNNPNVKQMLEVSRWWNVHSLTCTAAHTQGPFLCCFVKLNVMAGKNFFFSFFHFLVSLWVILPPQGIFWQYPKANLVVTTWRGLLLVSTE